MTDSNPPMSCSLSQQEIDNYNTHGFVIPEFRFTAQRVAQLRGAMDRVIAENPNKRPEQLVSVHVTDSGREGVKGDPVFFDLAKDEAVLDMVEQLIGPDIVLWGCQAFCKPGGDGMEVPMHQDGHYWPIQPLATCTAWIAIDDSTAENGCMRVVPGSHRRQTLFKHRTEDRSDIVLNQRVSDEGFEDSTAVDVELKAGQLSLHDVYLIHGSNANLSPRRRAGIAIRYMPATSHFQRDTSVPGTNAGYRVDFATRPIFLVRGLDRTGKNDFSVGH